VLANPSLYRFKSVKGYLGANYQTESGKGLFLWNPDRYGNPESNKEYKKLY
jgi:hypothetical protein